MRLRREMGIETIWCKPKRTSIPDNGHRKYPYLLRDRIVEWAGEAWCADITNVPMPHGHAYLCAVMDWRSRKVLGWAVSNAIGLGTDGKAAGGSRGALPGPARDLQHGSGQAVHVAGMDGKTRRHGDRREHGREGQWMDNVFIERLWRSVKYEDIYLKGYATIGDLEAGLG